MILTVRVRMCSIELAVEDYWTGILYIEKDGQIIKTT